MKATANSVKDDKKSCLKEFTRLYDPEGMVRVEQPSIKRKRKIPNIPEADGWQLRIDRNGIPMESNKDGNKRRVRSNLKKKRYIQEYTKLTADKIVASLLLNYGTQIHQCSRKRLFPITLRHPLNGEKRTLYRNSTNNIYFVMRMYKERIKITNGDGFIKV